MSQTCFADTSVHVKTHNDGLMKYGIWEQNNSELLKQEELGTNLLPVYKCCINTP